MLLSIYFLFSVGLLLTGFMVASGNGKPQRFERQFTINFIVVLCYGTLVAGILNILSIPINIKSIGTIYLITAVIVFGYIFKNKKYTKINIEKKEIISILILFFLWLLVELKTYSYEMRASYGYNTDVGNHLGMALSIVRKQKVSGMYFAALYNALVIEVFKPLFEGLKMYKGFVFAECIHSLFELIFYHSIIYDIVKKKYTSIVLTILLWAGWPLFNFISGGYVYWGWGAILLVFVVYELDCALDADNSMLHFLASILGLIGIVFCYNLFAPLCALYIGIYGILVLKKKKLHIDRRKGSLLVCCGIACILAIVYVYYTFFVKEGIDIFAQLKVHGGHFGPNIFGDFIWFLPIIFLFYYSCIKKLISPGMFGIAYITSWGFQICLLIAFEFRLISDYYYFKFYYPLWVLMWMVVSLAISKIPIKKEEYKYWMAYIVTVIIVLINSFGFIPEIINGISHNWLTRESDLGTQVYYMNARQLTKDYEDLKYSTFQFDLCEHAVDINEKTGEDVAFAYWWDIGGQNNWYVALTGLQSTITLDIAVKRDESNWKERIKEFPYYVMLKESELYKNNKKYFDEQEWVYENEEGFIVHTDLR